MRLPAVAFALLLSASLLPASGGGERGVTILYSASLNGNLDGCACKGSPKAGLVKRAAWLRAHRSPEECILVDAGDVLEVSPDELLSEAVLETYAELAYDAVAVGDQELSDGIVALLDYRERYPLLSHNLSLCPDENRCIFFSLDLPILSRGSLRVGLISLIDPTVFSLYPEDTRAAVKVSSPGAVAPTMAEDLEARGADLIVLLYHGPLEAARALALKLESLDVVVVGHEQRLIDAERVGRAVLVSPGEEGNRLGVLSVSVDQRGRVRVENRFELFRWESRPDDPAVRRRIEEYRTEMRRRVKER